MARLDTALLVGQATFNLKRANEVRKDPAVAKAGEQFLDDVKRATESGFGLLAETSASWKRNR